MHAELLPIAVNGGQTAKRSKPDDVVPLSDRLSEALREAWFQRISDQLLNADSLAVFGDDADRDSIVKPLRKELSKESY